MKCYIGLNPALLSKTEITKKNNLKVFKQALYSFFVLYNKLDKKRFFKRNENYFRIKLVVSDRECNNKYVLKISCP